MKFILIIIITVAVNTFSQSDRFTKSLENGNAWKHMEDPVQYYSTSKETYLSSILQRYRLTQEEHPEIASLNCKEEMATIYEDKHSDKISMTDIVKEVDQFYMEEQNIIIPIIFAYCYTIKKISGMGKNELDDYKNEILAFCKE